MSSATSARRAHRSVPCDEVLVKKVESDRDRLIERLLPAAMRARDTAAPDACVDAETAAAWADAALDPRERAIVETHAANCERCRALLAMLVRTNPPAPPTSWFRASVLAWAAPLTAAAAALVVWTMMPPRAATVRVERTASVDAAAPAPAPSPSPSIAPPAPAPLARAEPAPRARPDVERRADVQRKERREKQELADSGRDQSAPLAQALPPVAAPAAPAPAPATAPLAANKAVAAGPPPAAPPSADERVASRAALAGAAQSAARPLAESTTMRQFRAAAPPALIVSTNSRSRWLIGANGVVQHSTDGGSTWETQQTGASVTLTAGASPAASICWLVGPGGVVLLSTDGRSWRTLPFGEKIDLVSVRATDEKSATVTAAGGRTFTTTDGGQTWTAR